MTFVPTQVKNRLADAGIASVRAVIFDMDGLMLDSERIYREIFNRAAADCGLEFPLSLHEKLLGRTTADTRLILRELWQDDAIFEKFMLRSDHHHDECFEATPPALKDGLIELLDFLEARRIPKVVATSTRRPLAIPRLEKAGLLNRFLAVATGDQVTHGKPAPDLFLLAASLIPMAPEQCVVLEDSEAGVTAAHAADITVCMVPDMKQPSDEVREKAQGVYPSLREVCGVLREIHLGN